MELAACFKKMRLSLHPATPSGREPGNWINAGGPEWDMRQATFARGIRIGVYLKNFQDRKRWIKKTIITFLR
jgi:hypothetical protein